MGWNVRGSSPVGSEFSRTHPDRPCGPPSLLYNLYLFIPWGKAAEAWRWPPTQNSAEVKERVELYLYSPFGPSWPVIEWNVPLRYIYLFNDAISSYTLDKLSLSSITKRRLCAYQADIGRSGDACEWSGSCSGRFTVSERATVTRWTGEYLGLRASLDNLENIQSPLAEICSD